MDPFFLRLVQYPVSGVILVVTLITSLSAFRVPGLAGRLLLHPWRMSRNGEWYRLVSYGTVHADFMHLAFNMIALYSVASPLEAVLGPWRFLAVYVGSMVLGAVPTTLRRRHDPEYRSLGASGAVSGLFISGMLFFPMAEVYLFLLPVPMPWVVFAGGFILVSVIGTKRGVGNIGHEVHLYGGLSGLALTALLEPLAIPHFLGLTGLG